jgi:hypothetical protein
MTTLLASLLSTAAAVAVPAGDPAGGGGVAAPAAAFHAIAFVNDPLSHGTLGDGLLSLHEAILLHNGTLLPSQLSAAEAAQLSLIPGTGNTSDVTWIDIDAANTPLITIQQDLAPILDTPFGLLIKGFGDQVVFDFSGPGITHGLRVPSNSFSLQDIALVGGPYGLDVTQTDVTGQAGLSLQNVRFEGQATFGVNVTGAVQNAPGRAVLDRCRFVNVPLAFQTFEMAAGRSGIYELHDVEIAGATWGFWATLGAGGFSRFTFDRVDIDASTRGILITRLAVPSGRQVYVEGDHVRVRSADCAQIVGHPTGATWAILRGWDLRATGGGIALALGDPGHAVFGEVAELTAEGVVQLGCGAGPQPLALRNARCRNGPVTLATSATQALTVTESRFDGCAVSTLGGGPIAIAQSCFVGGSLQGSAAAPLQLVDSFAANAGAHVAQANPLPAAQLGSMAIAPAAPQVGATVVFQADLPTGLVGVFALGFTAPAPAVLAPTLRVYFDLAAYVTLPGAYFGQQGFAWQAPNNAALVGTDLVAHLAVLPAGIAAPALQLPPPRRFVLR